MKPLKHIFGLLLVPLLFTYCSSAQKLELKSPIAIGKVECQSWIAGVKGGGSGINLFIPVLEEFVETMKLDSAYFRGKVALLKPLNDSSKIYVARFDADFNKKEDILINPDTPLSDKRELTKSNEKIPFDLKASECVISCREGSETKYFKIENIVEKQPEHYPSAPPNRQ